MGKSVQIKVDYTVVLLPDGKPHNAGDIVALTDVEYAGLSAAVSRAITLLGNVTDPVRIDSDVYSRLNENNKFQKTDKVGFVGIEADGAEGITSFIGQANATNGQMRFRLSRANADPNNGRDFLINPYIYGMGIEYPGLIEIWSTGVSFHNNNRGTAQNLGGQIWVDNEEDGGGIWMTAWDNHGPLLGTPYTVICSQKFDTTSHGPIKFQVRATTDTFDFQQGANGSEVTKFQIKATGTIDVGGVIQASTLGATPTVADTDNLGAVPTVVGNASRGVISCGTGVAPSAGDIVTLTVPAGYTGTPVIVVSASNFASNGLQPYAYQVSATEFKIGIGITPQPSQAAGTYKFSYIIMG